MKRRKRGQAARERLVLMWKRTPPKGICPRGGKEKFSAVRVKKKRSHLPQKKIFVSSGKEDSFLLCRGTYDHWGEKLLGSEKGRDVRSEEGGINAGGERGRIQS